jgi:hypothetical protein
MNNARACFSSRRREFLDFGAIRARYSSRSERETEVHDVFRKGSMSEAERQLRADLATAIRDACAARRLFVSIEARAIGVKQAQVAKVLMSSDMTKDGRGARLSVFVSLAQKVGAMTPDLRRRVKAVEAEHVSHHEEKVARLAAVKKRGPRVAEEVAAPGEVAPVDEWPADLMLVRVSDGVVVHVREPTAEILPMIESGEMRPYREPDRAGISAMFRLVAVEPVIAIIDIDDPEPGYTPRARGEPNWAAKAAWANRHSRGFKRTPMLVRAVGKVVR